jgi:hypothetical protein
VGMGRGRGFSEGRAASRNRSRVGSDGSGATRGMARCGLLLQPPQHPDTATLACPNPSRAPIPSSLHKVHEEDGKPFEIEMSWICDESGRVHQRVRAGGGRATSGAMDRRSPRNLGAAGSPQLRRLPPRPGARAASAAKPQRP